MQQLETFVGNLEVGELLQRAGVDMETLARRILARRRERRSTSAPLSLDPRVLVAHLSRLVSLTPTEEAVAHLLLWGATDREIADRVRCSERTAKRYVAHVLGKAGAKNRASLMRVLFEDAGISEADVFESVEARRR